MAGVSVGKGEREPLAGCRALLEIGDVWCNGGLEWLAVIVLHESRLVRQG